MSRKLLVIALVFGLLVGNLAYAPVVLGGQDYPYYLTMDSGLKAYPEVKITKFPAPSGIRIEFRSATHSDYGASTYPVVGSTSFSNGYSDYSSYFVYNAYISGDDQWFGYSCLYVGSTGEDIIVSPTPGTYNHSYFYSLTVPGDAHWALNGGTGSWLDNPTGTAGAGDLGDGWVAYDDPGMGVITPPELSVTIDSGPTSVDLVNGGTWHAAATGGTTPYTYYWDWMILGGSYHYNTPFDPVGPTGSDTYSHTWSTAGTYVLECMVQDAAGTWADGTYQVSAAAVIGSYHALFARYGDKGQYLNVQVDDAAGNPVTISSTASTQYGLYEAGGAFGWFAADSEAAQLVTYTWRWVMSYTVTPPGLALPPPADFWIETSIHLAVPNIDLQVTHHFTSLSETLDLWYGPGGDQQVPETPPSETSTLPDWLQPVYDMFVRLLRFLFVPSASDFSAQLASGWILIASPVPSITPQYTLPFPNPQHLLAPTGDSVNIDFSVVQGYAGYSIMHTIVQVLMYAILVFIALGIVT